MIWHQKEVSSTLKSQVTLQKQLQDAKIIASKSSYKFTPWDHPEPPTVPLSCSSPSDWSEAPKNSSKWFPLLQTMGFDAQIKSITFSESMLQFDSSKLSLASYSPSTLFWPSVQSQAPENGPKWFIIAKHMGIDSKSKSVLSLEPKLQFHSLKSFLASYSPFPLFLTFRSIWGSWKWSQMIPLIQDPWVDIQTNWPALFGPIPPLTPQMR